MNVQFSSTFLDQLRTRVDLSNLVAKRTKLSRHGKMFRGKCPFHNEKTPSFYVYEDQGTYHCYGCEAHGDAISFIMHFEGYTFPETVKQLADQVGISLPKSDKLETQQINTTPLHECLEAATTWFQSQLLSNVGEKARQYTESRHFNPTIVQQFRLGYAPSHNRLMQFLLQKGFEKETLLATGLIIDNDDKQSSYDRFRDRLMFPICNKQGRVIGFGGRVLGLGEPKYLNSPETELFHKSHELYGHHIARKADFKSVPLIICEGYTDVLALHQAGYTGAVASLGTALTESQIELLWRMNPVPLLCFDGDAAGQKAAVRAAERGLSILKAGHSLDFVTLSNGDDPASLLEKGHLSSLSTILTQKIGLADLLWHHAIASGDFKTPEQRALLQQQLMGYARQIKDYSLQNIYKKFFKDKVFEYFRFNKGPKKPLFISQRPRIDRQERQHAILLVTLINHTEILHEVFESLSRIKIIKGQLKELCNSVIEYYNSHHALDVLSLRHHLCMNGYEKLLDSLDMQTALHAPFAGKHANIKDALKGWWSVWNQCQAEQVEEEELTHRRHDFAQDMSPEKWQRIQKMRQDKLIEKEQQLFES